MASILDRFKENTVETVIDTSKKVRVGIIGTGWIAEAHIDSYKRMVERQKKDFEAEKERYERSHRIDWKFYSEASGKLEAAEEKIAVMKKGIWSYLKVCRKDRRDERLKEKRLRRERKERQKSYEEAERRQAKIIKEMKKSGYGRGV